MNTAGSSLSIRQHSHSHGRQVSGRLGSPFHCLPTPNTNNGHHVSDQDRRRSNRSWSSSWLIITRETISINFYICININQNIHNHVQLYLETPFHHNKLFR